MCTLDMESKFYPRPDSDDDEWEVRLRIEGNSDLPESKLWIEDETGTLITMSLASFLKLTAEVAKYERLVAEAQKDEAA